MNNPASTAPIWKEAIADLCCGVMIFAFGWFFIFQDRNTYDEILNNSFTITTTNVRDITFLEGGSLYSCELPTSTKIETIRANFAENEIPENPTFEIAINYPNDNMGQGMPMKYAGKDTLAINAFNKAINPEYRCHLTRMTIDAEELALIVSRYHSDAILMTPASDDYFIY